MVAAAVDRPRRAPTASRACRMCTRQATATSPPWWHAFIKVAGPRVDRASLRHPPGWPLAGSTGGQHAVPRPSPTTGGSDPTVAAQSVRHGAAHGTRRSPPDARGPSICTVRPTRSDAQEAAQSARHSTVRPPRRSPFVTAQSARHGAVRPSRRSPPATAQSARHGAVHRTRHGPSDLAQSARHGAIHRTWRGLPVAVPSSRHGAVRRTRSGPQDAAQLVGHGVVHRTQSGPSDTEWSMGHRVVHRTQSGSPDVQRPTGRGTVRPPWLSSRNTTRSLGHRVVHQTPSVHRTRRSPPAAASSPDTERSAVETRSSRHGKARRAWRGSLATASLVRGGALGSHGAARPTRSASVGNGAPWPYGTVCPERGTLQYGLPGVLQSV